MGRARKHSIEAIHQICLDYREGLGSYQIIAQQLNIDKKTIQLWESTYKKLAQEAFIHKPRNRSYTKEFKDEAVQEYVQGKGVLLDLAIKYSLSGSTISKGVQVYYHGGEQKAYDPKGKVYIMKSRKYGSDTRQHKKP